MRLTFFSTVLLLLIIVVDLPPLGLARSTLVARLDILEAVRMEGCVKYALLSLGGIKSTSRD